MTDYIKHKEYKLPNGRTVTANFNELGQAMITIQAMDALFDIFNSSDVVEVVRCKDCVYSTEYCGSYPTDNYCRRFDHNVDDSDFCSKGDREDD